MNVRKARTVLWAVVMAFAAALATATVLSRIAENEGQAGKGGPALEGLKVFGNVPDFSLIERGGERVSLSDLGRQVWIVDFIYTSCKDTCPLQSTEMSRLQDDLRDRPGIKLVSITVDPEIDTPRVLSRYADRFHADPNRWFFLSGEKDEIYRLAREGFRLSAVPAGDAPDVILHSSRFVLVDDQGRIRGYYDSSDREAIKRLRRDAVRLVSTVG